MSEADMQAIYATALRLLSDLGVGEVPDVLLKPFLAAGTTFGDCRVFFPYDLVERAIGLAARTFTFHGRDPARSIEVGGEAVHFGTGGAAGLTLDIDSGDYRPSTLCDLDDFTRLQDTLTNVSCFTRCCVATDLPDIFGLDVNTVLALMKGTTKPVAISFTITTMSPRSCGWWTLGLATTATPACSAPRRS